MNMRRLVSVALFAAVVVALGLLFLTVPNLELVTMTCFLAGYFLGLRDGVIAAAVGEGLYSLLNPLGVAAPPMLAAQILSVSLAALAGSLTARRAVALFRLQGSTAGGRDFSTVPAGQAKNQFLSTKFWSRLRIAGYFALVGLLLTITFDVLTTFSFTIFVGSTLKVFITSLIFGLPFYLLHIGSNTLIFALVVPITISRLNNFFEHTLGSRG
jgi:hypothetical protein